MLLRFITLHRKLRVAMKLTVTKGKADLVQYHLLYHCEKMQRRHPQYGSHCKRQPCVGALMSYLPPSSMTSLAR